MLIVKVKEVACIQKLCHVKQNTYLTFLNVLVTSCFNLGSQTVTHPYQFRFLSLAPFMPAFPFSNVNVNLLGARYHTYDLTLAPASMLCQFVVPGVFEPHSSKPTLC